MECWTQAPSSRRFPLEGRIRMPRPCWLVGLFIFLSLFFTYWLVCTHGLEWIPRTGTGRQTVRCQDRKDGDEAALCAWDPKTVSPWGVTLTGSEPVPQHHRVTRPERPVEGGWSRKGVQPRDRSLTQRILSELLAGRAPLRLFFLRACALNTNQAASLGYHTNWPQTPRQ